MGSRKVGFMLDEEVLRVSSPEYVYDWLKTRAINSANAGDVSSISLRYRLLEAGDYELEETLLLRNDPLIDLGLARFCINENVGRRLFAKSIDYERTGISETHARAIRIGLLYNQWLMFGEILESGVIDGLLESATKEELAAICENPNPRDKSLLLPLIEKIANKSSRLSDEKKLTAISALAKNNNFSDSVSFDIYDDLEIYEVQKSLWRLVKTLPVEKVWASALAELLCNLKPMYQVFTFEEIIELSERWHPDSERKSKTTYLSSFGVIRQRIGRIAFSSNYDEAETLLNNDDVALRCAAYAHAKLTPALIKSAYELDGGVVLEYLLGNNSAWSSPEKREVIKNIMSNEDYTYSFAELENEWAKSHPQYFASNDYPQSKTIDSLSEKIFIFRNGVIDDHNFIFKWLFFNFAITGSVLVYLLVF